MCLSAADSVLSIDNSGLKHRKKDLWVVSGDVGTFARTSMTSGACYEVTKRHVTSVITRIERFPLVVPPIVKL